MIKVITYGTYDLLHYGHIRLLQRAKALGDYLIVAVTADDFDKKRGKINVHQTLMERIEGVKALGIADEIIVEEYEGQKIDDIRKYDVDIFTVGSDWIGKFDYLNSFCKVVYIDRTEGISSSDIRSQKRDLKVGLVGESKVLEKFVNESEYVNGIKIIGLCSQDNELLHDVDSIKKINEYGNLLDVIDAVYVLSHPNKHYEQIKLALNNGKHVLCDSPITLNICEYRELLEIAKEKHVILMEGIKTAYSTAYHRLLLLVKSGLIGEVVSVDATCTSLREVSKKDIANSWNSICAWGPIALLPVFQLLGTEYIEKQIISRILYKEDLFDGFTKVNFVYSNAVATIKVGSAVKSEGELIISGTKGYVYVPAPWWKTDYFEIRYENMSENQRYFYQLDGEGIRNEIVAFVKAIENNKLVGNIETNVSEAIVKIMQEYYRGHYISIDSDLI